VVGAGNVGIFTTTELERDPQGVIRRAMEFVGLCPYEPTYTAENVRAIQVRPFVYSKRGCLAW
jgi:hypothetical protein